MLQSLPPVAGVGQRGEQCLPEAGQLIRLEYGDRCGDGHKHGHEAGQQSPGPPDPEAAQIQPSSVIPGRGQQVGDQVSADDEEDIHAEEPAGQAGELFMERHDRQHRDTAQAVKTGRPRT